jgi:hypothetical protein
MVAGGFDYLLKTRMADMAAYRESQAGLRARPPKMAVPTRTIVLPALIAASRSALMPSDSVSSSIPALRIDSKTACARRNNSRCAAKSGGRFGDRHEPAQPQLWQSRHSLRQGQDLVRRQPDLLAPPSTLTCRQTLQRRQAGRPLLDRRSAIFSRSTCAPSRSARPPGGVLLLCRGPMQCHSRGRQAGAAPRSCPPLLHIVFAEGRWPVRMRRRARPPRRRSWTPPAAVRSAGFRPAVTQAVVIRSRTSWRLRTIIVIIEL